MSSDGAPPPTLRPSGVHHVAVIASDYARSRRFYTQVLGLQVVLSIVHISEPTRLLSK